MDSVSESSLAFLTQLQVLDLGRDSPDFPPFRPGDGLQEKEEGMEEEEEIF